MDQSIGISAILTENGQMCFQKKITCFGFDSFIFLSNNERTQKRIAKEPEWQVLASFEMF